MVNEGVVYVDFTYNIKNEEVSVKDTNLKSKAIPEIVEWAIRCQVEEGEDNSPLNVRGEYRIRVSCDLYKEDKVIISSDTGNKGLTAGILIHALGNLEKLVDSQKNT